MIVVAAPLTDVDAALNRLLLLTSLVIVGTLVLLGLVAWAVVRVGLLPLDRIGHTAGAIAGGDLSHRVETTDPRSEVGRLGIAFNAMLDRLEDAFDRRRASEDRLRRFLADASHELRTPLASIRGYAELFRMGAASSPEEVAKAMRRIEDEAARMGVLVEDLLTLARLDEIAEAPHTEVDLSALAADAVGDAAAVAPDRAIGLEAEPGATVLGDAHQLRQVLGNLLRNAVVHTPAGTPIDVRVVADGAVRLDVRDHGPGLPTGDPAELFERFWRAEGGRERGRAGAGLGLAIVAAIVDAHGGRVSAANASGGGAVFSVVLPAAVSGARASRGWGGGAGELRLGGEAAKPPARPVRGRARLVVDFYNGAGKSGRRARANRRRPALRRSLQAGSARFEVSCPALVSIYDHKSGQLPLEILTTPNGARTARAARRFPTQPQLAGVATTTRIRRSDPDHSRNSFPARTSVAERAMPSISSAVSARPSVFETQYTARGVRQATSRRRPPSLYSAYSRPPMRRVLCAAARIGGCLQVVPWTP